MPPLFEDVTARSGVRFRYASPRSSAKYMVETMGSGCGFIDADGNGRLDILFPNAGPIPGARMAARPGMALYRNNGNGTFSDATRVSGLAGQDFFGMGVAVGDYDNDGRQDFYVSSALSPGRLFHNEGGGRFRDVTDQAGVAIRGKWGSSCAWLDYDRDGLLDLFVGSYVKYATLKDDLPCFATNNARIYCVPQAYETCASTLFHNEGGGRFRNVSEASGIARSNGKALGVSIWDYDADGWPDLFVSNDTVPSQLFHNERNGRFREVGMETGIATDDAGNSHSGMGIDTADLLNDGRTWLIIANFQGQQTSLYEQAATGVFEDERLRAGIAADTGAVLGFGAMFLDYDDDGYRDFVQVCGHVEDNVDGRVPGVTWKQPTLMFHNLHDGRFREVGLRAGAPFTDKRVARGVAAGDVRNDGSMWLVITDNDGPARLWRNRTRSGGHWLEVKLIGTRSNRDGNGAMILVSAGGVTQRQMVRCGSSYLSQSDLRPHFGLGSATQASMEVRWPSGAIERFPAMSADRIWTVTEGKGVPR